MNTLSKLSPRPLWEIFEKICSIPHPSKKEEKIIAFAKSFGEELGLETIVDEIGNVIIRKPATPGMEKLMGVILQGHLDMVPQKNSDTLHDFEKDPILPRIEGEWIKATGTTLGADNGIGCAAAMAVLKSKDIQHGPIEVLLTIDEETGMTGAFGLKPGILKGDILINLDSEDEGELYIGCAGGIDANIEFNFKKENVPANSIAYKVSLTGLKGGHSGMDINMGRGNSNKLLFRYFYALQKKIQFSIASIDGGSLRNAIPREAFATVLINEKDVDVFEKSINEFEWIIKSELSVTEPDIKLSFEKVTIPEFIMDSNTIDNLIKSINSCVNGAIRMSDDMPGLVETSTNLAIVKSDDKSIIIRCLLRSSVDSAKVDLGNVIESNFLLAGANVSLEGGYPGWKPNVHSPILKTMKSVFEKKYGKTPEIKAIHAGLECGLFSTVYPKWDMISFGPTIRHPHSPDEKVHIESVGKFWDFLVEVLKNIPAK